MICVSISLTPTKRKLTLSELPLCCNLYVLNNEIFNLSPNSLSFWNYIVVNIFEVPCFFCVSIIVEYCLFKGFGL